jgi:lipoprotein-anchoring transpeptidase ErfK/SrfK
VLKSSASKRHSRAGDLLAVLLLIAIVAGAGWLWWREKQPSQKPARHSSTVVINKKGLPVVPSLTVVERKIEIPPETNSPVLPPPVSGISSNAPVVQPPAKVAEYPRPAKNIFEAQIALARRVVSPGAIDGAIGSQTRAALATFQRLQNLPLTRAPDTNTYLRLTLAAPVLQDYVVTTNDLARLQPLGKSWVAKSQQSALEYETILELAAEKGHAYQSLIQKLNPDVNWSNVTAGTVLKIPEAAYPEPAEKAARVVIHLSDKFLEAFGSDTNLLAHFPCSIAARVEKRPVGELHVSVVAPNPNYTFDPEIFAESPEAQAIGHKLVLKPGPNNPVGVAWIGLDKPGYGMHGTPGPEQIGRTESHGCFRLANWDAEYLVKLVWIGMPVDVEP